MTRYREGKSRMEDGTHKLLVFKDLRDSPLPYCPVWSAGFNAAVRVSSATAPTRRPRVGSSPGRRLARCTGHAPSEGNVLIWCG
jgi:hypothetical protein